MSAEPPVAPPTKGLRLPSDRRILPPTVQAIVFLLIFRAVIALGSGLWTWWWAPGGELVARAGTTVFILVVASLFTTALAGIVIRGWIIAPYVLTVMGALGAANVIYATMIDVLFAASSALLVIFAWAPATREHGRGLRAARRGGPRLPYRYEGPPLRREDFPAGR